MSRRAGRESKQLYLTTEEVERARAVAPISDAGSNRGKRSLSKLMIEIVELGELARPLVAPGELPWSVVRALVQDAVDRVERKAPRRVRP
jgi:hypothetical protein